MSINNTMSSSNDASNKYFVHKVPNTTIKFGDLSQNLSTNSPFNISSPIYSRCMGNPSNLTLFLKSDTAVTITISLSPDGVSYFQYGTIVLAANSSSVTTIPGAGFVELVPSVNINSFSGYVVANS